MSCSCISSLSVTLCIGEYYFFSIAEYQSKHGELICEEVQAGRGVDEEDFA